MNTTQILLVTMIIGMQIGIFIGGVCLGRFMCISNGETYTKPPSFLKTAGRNKNSETTKQTIQIDDKKFVTQITTDGMEKKYDTIGKEQVSDKDISSSINKLKNMKN